MVPYTFSNLAQATTLTPSGAPGHMTLHSKAPKTMIGSRGALCTASAPVIAMTSALSTFFRKNSHLPKVSPGPRPLRASIHSTAERKPSGKDEGQPSAIRAAR